MTGRWSKTTRVAEAVKDGKDGKKNSEPDRGALGKRKTMNSQLKIAADVYNSRQLVYYRTEIFTGTSQSV